MKIKQTLLFFALFIGVNVFLISPVALAAVGDLCGSKVVKAGESCCGGNIAVAGESCCGGVVTSIISCDQAGNGSGKCPDGIIYTAAEIKSGSRCSDGSIPDVTSNSGIWGILLLVINILTAGIGIVAVGGIIYGSVLYASAGGSPEQVKKAKTIIINIVIGLLAFALMYSFLNFIIPGGLFS